MKFGEMKYDVPFEKIKSAVSGDFNFYERYQVASEGKRLLKTNPEYKYLENDPSVKNSNDFYRSVVYAYMVDQIIKKNPNLIEEYKKRYDGDNEYRLNNYSFVFYYREYLREQADPGCHAREEAQHKKELQESIAFHAAIAKIDEEQHPHVPCPYCKSTNTEKISTMSRAVSVSLVGAASGKIGKQWHCKQCGSNF